jgi:hypothetical protein
MKLYKFNGDKNRDPQRYAKYKEWERIAELAPEMLEALRMIESCLSPDDNDVAARAVREAIKKARG